MKAQIVIVFNDRKYSYILSYLLKKRKPFVPFLKEEQAFVPFLTRLIDLILYRLESLSNLFNVNYLCKTLWNC